MRLAQRAGHGGKPPRAFTELLLRADQLGHVLDRVDLIANGFLQALRKHEPLLGRRGRRLRLDRRARLIGWRPDQGVGADPAQRAHELAARQLGAAATPSVAVDDQVESGIPNTQHVGNIVDRRQSLLVKPPRFFKHLRRNLPFRHVGALPPIKNAPAKAGAFEHRNAAALKARQAAKKYM